MARDDPFRGLHLSEQVGPGKIEQRLFSPPKPAPGPTSRVGERPAESPSEKLPQPTKPLPAKPAASTFDLKERPLFKVSFLYTEEEIAALEKLRVDLAEQLDQKVTKNELLRAALHLLLEDHATSGARSYATRKIRRR